MNAYRDMEERITLESLSLGIKADDVARMKHMREGFCVFSSLESPLTRPFRYVLCIANPTFPWFEHMFEYMYVGLYLANRNLFSFPR